MSKDLDQLWAWVTETPEGITSLISAHLPLGLGATVLISHDREVMLRLQHLAEAHGRAVNQPVWLRLYVAAEDHGRITSTLQQRH